MVVVVVCGAEVVVLVEVVARGAEEVVGRSSVLGAEVVAGRCGAVVVVVRRASMVRSAWIRA